MNSNWYWLSTNTWAIKSRVPRAASCLFAPTTRAVDWLHRKRWLRNHIRFNIQIYSYGTHTHTQHTPAHTVTHAERLAKNQSILEPVISPHALPENGELQLSSTCGTCGGVAQECLEWDYNGFSILYRQLQSNCSQLIEQIIILESALERSVHPPKIVSLCATCCVALGLVTLQPILSDGLIY